MADEATTKVVDIFDMEPMVWTTIESFKELRGEQIPEKHWAAFVKRLVQELPSIIKP